MTPARPMTLVLLLAVAGASAVLSGAKPLPAVVQRTAPGAPAARPPDVTAFTTPTEPSGSSRLGRPVGPTPPGGPAPSPRTTRDVLWVPPLAPVQVLRAFDPPAVRWGAGHRGVDLGAPAGTTVLAPRDGTVAFAGVVAGRPVLSVDHDGGIRTTYEPVTPLVTPGTRVRRGEPIGVVAGPPHCPGGCVHWGARRGETYLDPLALLRRRPVVLLPLP